MQRIERYLDCKMHIYCHDILLGLSETVIKGYEFEIAHN